MNRPHLPWSPATLCAAAGATLAAFVLAGCSAAQTGAADTVTAAAPAAGFTCPSGREIAELTAMAFNPADVAGATCSYATSGNPPVRITIQHPSAAAATDLGSVRSSVTAASVQPAPALSPDAFFAQAADGSCTAYTYARDLRVMSIQVSRAAAAPTTPCDLARTVAVLAGTSTARPVVPTSSTTAATTPSTPVTTSPGAPTSRLSTTGAPKPPATTVKPSPGPKPPAASTSDHPLFTTGPVVPFSLPAHP